VGGVPQLCVPGTPAPSDATCDGIDDDCDGATDEDAAAPSGSPALSLDDAQLSWSALAGATGYDVVRGDLHSLRAGGGDFTAATAECLANDRAALSLPYMFAPGPAAGWWFLVRGASCGGAGTYDSSAPSQSGSRDAEIGAAPGSCP
jgi:hypothetical protein